MSLWKDSHAIQPLNETSALRLEPYAPRKGLDLQRACFLLAPSGIIFTKLHPLG